jgi:ubiquinone/menaquinone biosynthesis C-methylase UbiE
VTVQLFHCDARSLPLADESVQTCVTSVPYLRQRRYSNDPREIGREVTHVEWVAQLVQVFREVRRVLRPDGTCWINVGDKAAESGMGGGGQLHG